MELNKIYNENRLETMAKIPENFLVIYAKSNKQIFCKNMEASSFGEAEMKAKTAFLKENIAKNEKIRILQITVYN